MGFPVTEDDVLRTGVMCQFSRGFPNVPGCRSRASQLMQIGNAMHVESIGSVLLTVFLKLAKPLNMKKFGIHSQIAMKLQSHRCVRGSARAAVRYMPWLAAFS